MDNRYPMDNFNSLCDVVNQQGYKFYKTLLIMGKITNKGITNPKPVSETKQQE